MRSRLNRSFRSVHLLALVLVAARAGAQEPEPSPIVREQDELDFGRLSVAIGSGARALGMGGAFLARPDDATAASWNPAGLSYLRLPEVSLVGAFHSQDEKTRSGVTLTRSDHTQGTTPDFLSMAVPITIGSASGSVQLGFQRVIPYTGERSILDDAPKTIEASGGFDVLTLGTGLKLNRWLRAGITVNRWFNGFHQQRERERRRSIQDVDFAISGYSFNAGMIVQAHDTLNLGLIAKTRMRGDVQLERTRRDFTTNPNAPDTVTYNQHSSDTVRLDLPGAVGFGASWRPASPLTLSADYTRTFWSRSRVYNYFTLAAGTSTFEPQMPDVFPSLPFPNVTDAAQNDTNELRLGVEYVLISGALKLPLRTGYFRATQYRRDADGGNTHLDGLTAGAGAVLGPVLVDAAYVYQWGGRRAGEAAVTTRNHSALFSLIYRHGAH